MTEPLDPDLERGIHEDPDDDDPSAPAWHLYHVLTYFHGELIDLLLEHLPEAGLED